MKIRNKENIEVFCKYCERATPLITDGKYVCSKKGVVTEDYKCRKFIYDPLKRAPKILTLDTSNVDFEISDDTEETLLCAPESVEVSVDAVAAENNEEDASVTVKTADEEETSLPDFTK